MLLTDEIKVWIGCEVHYPARDELGRASIRYFPLAMGDENPLYLDEAYAREAGACGEWPAPGPNDEAAINLDAKTIDGRLIMREAVIVSTARTPIGRAFRGAFNNIKSPTLLGHAIHHAVIRANIDAAEIEDAVIGCCLTAGTSSMNVARLGVIAAGLPLEASAQTIDRQCSSGLMAIATAAKQVMVDCMNVTVAGGLENISAVQNEYYQWSGRTQDEAVTARAPHTYMPMLETAEFVSKKYGITREAHDQYALLRALKPVIEGGVVTAGNASQLSDGASGCVVMERSLAERRGIQPLGLYRGISVSGCPPEEMGIGPIYAIPKLLKLHGLKVSDIGLWELNEAFACQALYCRDHLGIDPAIYNVNGGSISIGHPYGMSGARLVGCVVVAMCVGAAWALPACLRSGEPRLCATQEVPA